MIKNEINNINKTNNNIFLFSSFSYKCIINDIGKDDNYLF